MPSQSKPSWSTNLASSAATIARFRLPEMRSYGTHVYLQLRLRILRAQLVHALRHERRLADRMVAPPEDVRGEPQLRAARRRPPARRRAKQPAHDAADRALSRPSAAAGGRSSAKTGAVSGRTPRQRKKLSAACSISMPRPSAVRAAPWASRPAQERRRRVARRSCRRRTRPTRTIAGGHGGGVAGETRAGRVDHDVEGAPGQRFGRHRGDRARAARTARAIASAFANVRLPIVSERGRSASTELMMPRAAPPAPSTRTSRAGERDAEVVREIAHEARRRRCCRRTSRRRRASACCTAPASSRAGCARPRARRPRA